MTILVYGVALARRWDGVGVGWGGASSDPRWLTMTNHSPPPTTHQSPPLTTTHHHSPFTTTHHHSPRLTCPPHKFPVVEALRYFSMAAMPIQPLLAVVHTGVGRHPLTPIKGCSTLAQVTGSPEDSGALSLGNCFTCWALHLISSVRHAWCPWWGSLYIHWWGRWRRRDMEYGHMCGTGDSDKEGSPGKEEEEEEEEGDGLGEGCAPRTPRILCQGGEGGRRC